MPADWTIDTEITGAIRRLIESAAWYDQVAGWDGPKTATTTCFLIQCLIVTDRKTDGQTNTTRQQILRA